MVLEVETIPVSRSKKKNRDIQKVLKKTQKTDKEVSKCMITGHVKLLNVFITSLLSLSIRVKMYEGKRGFRIKITGCD